MPYELCIIGDIVVVEAWQGAAVGCTAYMNAEQTQYLSDRRPDVCEGVSKTLPRSIDMI
jgi:hypothetical protein